MNERLVLASDRSVPTAAIDTHDLVQAPGYVVYRGDAVWQAEDAIRQLIDSFERARPSNKVLLATRLPWPILAEAAHGRITGVIVAEPGPCARLTDLPDTQKKAQRSVSDMGWPDNFTIDDVILEVILDALRLAVAVEECRLSSTRTLVGALAVSFSSGWPCARLVARDGRTTTELFEHLLNTQTNDSINDRSPEFLEELARAAARTTVAASRDALSRLIASVPTAASKAGLSQLEQELRTRRRPEVASWAYTTARAGIHARWIVDAAEHANVPQDDPALAAARAQRDHEDFLASMHGVERLTHLRWSDAAFVRRAGVPNFQLDLDGDLPAAFENPDGGLDQVSELFIRSEYRELTRRAVDGRLGVAATDPVVRHAADLLLTTVREPVVSAEWGRWDANSASFPLRLSIEWPADPLIQRIRFERISEWGELIEMTVDRQLERPAADWRCTQRADSEGTARAQWIVALPGQSAYGSLGPSTRLVAPRIPSTTRQWRDDLRGPTSRDDEIDDERIRVARRQRTKATRRRLMKRAGGFIGGAIIIAAAWFYLRPLVWPPISELFSVEPSPHTDEMPRLQQPTAASPQGQSG